MGYDLHITKRRLWSGTGRDISVGDWQRVAETDAELRELEWDEGIVSAKNPEPPLIDKMCAVALRLGAIVQGDDGEIYTSAAEPPRPYRPSLGERLRAAASRLVPRRKIRTPLPPFSAGDIVKDSWGAVATVVTIDPDAMHGMGTITVRYESGREATQAMCAHGFKPVSPDQAARRDVTRP